MESSDDDMPIGKRASAKPAAKPPRRPSAASAKRTIEDSDKEDDVPLGRKAGLQRNKSKQKPTYADPSDSEDEKPLVKRTPAKPLAKGKPPPKSGSRPSTASTKKSSVKRPVVKPEAKPKNAKPATAKKPPKKEVSSTAVKEKKYSTPGQTRDQPDENDPLLKFYSSLYEQTDGGSDMATRWMLMHGLLPYEVAAAVVARIKQMKEAGKGPSNTPSKVNGSAHKSPLKHKPSPKKVKVKHEYS
mmetsp:Transcript_13426/g.38123  ORF Transcript_13426/g.38123 Transcript_13426/m.38123 type:complete len:243 (-) Transcript_13426:2610-3338(-)|eukprot:CAMPEP_0117658174 /NCGR_PEP_ID=MMETSP0804-20121206/5724_1 /TAXON_ID=1074897 /ORGANISM="Tetraselmis astigmatica, Strain CCMP880" /LENGTH=242 /DNA_ID=CAMNT_0005464679 /DNA_START=291 /DNA_END=1019 /DNA_ORIENTATION=+